MINNNYLETRKRICRFKGRNDLSDKEIIEHLAIEINDYRNRIQSLEEYIDKLKENQIEDTELEDKDVIEIITYTRYAEGKPIKSTLEYKYKDDIHEEIKEKISEKVRGDEVLSVIQPERLEAVYKAEIYEYDSGRIDIAYVCDSDKNKEGDKKSCTLYNDCKYTLNRKYAKNFYKKDI